MNFKNLIIAGSLSIALTACASVSESIPTVKVERKKPNRIQTVDASYSSSAAKVQKAEAPVVCENENMRKRAADNNSKNDTARLLIMEDGSRSNTVLADVTVNCKDYFENRGLWAGASSGNIQATSSQRIVSSAGNRRTINLPRTPQVTRPAAQHAIAAAPLPVQAEPEPEIVNRAEMIQASTKRTSQSRFHSVMPGDTMYSIGRRYCTDVKTLKRINEIYDASRISPQQLIKLPGDSCF